MKKKSFLLLIFFIAIIFAMIIMPNEVMASTQITEFRLYGDEIKEGNTIPTLAAVETVPANGVEETSTNVVWYKSSTGTELWSDLTSGMKTTGNFEIGKYYYVNTKKGLTLKTDFEIASSYKVYYNDVEIGSMISGTGISINWIEIFEEVTANITINDSTTENRGKFSIVNDVNSNKPESTSTLNVDLPKDCIATLYVTPELDYSIEKITVDGNEVSFAKDTSASGVNKPYKAIFTMDNDKDIIIYFKAKKTVNYDLSVIKKNIDVNKIDNTINKQQFVNQKKSDFINTINSFKTGKENVTDLSDEIISNLFTENKYAVITAIKYKDASYKASDDLIAIGDLSNWDGLQIAQGYLERTDNYEIEYTEVTIENYTYKFISGDNQEFTMSKIDKYTFRIDGDYSLFEELKVGNLTFVKDIDYTVTEGSTIITFTETGLTKLNTLVAGIYDVTVKYTDNTVTGKLIVKEETKQEENKTEENNTTNTIVENKTNNPKTGDTIMVFIAGLVLSVAGIYVTKKKLVK